MKLMMTSLMGVRDQPTNLQVRKGRKNLPKEDRKEFIKEKLRIISKKEGNQDGQRTRIWWTMKYID